MVELGEFPCGLEIVDTSDMRSRPDDPVELWLYQVPDLADQGLGGVKSRISSEMENQVSFAL